MPARGEATLRVHKAFGATVRHGQAGRRARVAGEVWQLVDSGGIGGIETHVRLLAHALIAAGHPTRVVLLADHGDNPWLGQLATDEVPLEVLDGRFGTLVRRMRAERPALVHTHGYKAGILGRIAARITGIPSVSTFHAGERGPFPVSLYQTLDEATSRLSRRIAVSRPIADRLPRPTAVIGNFVAVPEQAPAPPVADVVGFVGRLSAEKGPDLFCQIAASVASPPAFEIFGDGPMRADLEAGAAGRVRFHGLVTQPDRIWPQIGLLLMPSRAEGLPMAALEAMAAGVPVAAAAVGALPDLIRHGENGWLFAPGDVPAAAAIVSQWHAASADTRAGWSRAAWETVRTRYASTARLSDILAIYENAGWAGHG